MAADDVPPELLLRFFREATARLDEALDVEPGGGLDAHRRAVLDVQHETLRRVVDRTSVDPDAARTALRDLGASSSSEELTEASGAMNASARHAFARSVLREEHRARDDHRTSLRTEGAMAHRDVIDFCALCAAAVALPEVRRHLRRGGDVLYDDHDNDDDDDAPTVVSPAAVQERLTTVQNLMYRAVGYDADFGTEEMRRILRTPPERVTNDDDDEARTDELVTALRRFVEAMNAALNEAAGSSSSGTTELSDEHEGGCTRVVSVTFSEFDGGAPSNDVQEMEEHVEQRQQEQLRVARRAATLQQSILAELLTLEEEEREEALVQAKAAHDDFLERATELPVGPERIRFLRTVSPDTQRLLVMHKLWEKMLADNDGRAPVDRRSSANNE